MRTLAFASALVLALSGVPAFAQSANVTTGSSVGGNAGVTTGVGGAGVDSGVNSGAGVNAGRGGAGATVGAGAGNDANIATAPGDVRAKDKSKLGVGAGAGATTH